jgi:hypothetical protein
MHDAKDRPLKVGDVVLIPAVVLETYATEDYCNVKAESLIGRRPDDAKEQFYAINTGVMLRANPDDEEASVITGLAAHEAGRGETQ